MSDKRNYVSQKRKLIISLAASFLAGVLIYLLVSNVSIGIFDHKWNDPEWRHNRNASFIDNLQSYLSERNASIEDRETMMSWREQHSSIILSVQKDGKVVFGTDPEISALSEFSNGAAEKYPLRFSDSEADVYLLDRTDVNWRRGLNALALLMGFLVFAFSFWLLIRRNVQRLVNLSAEVNRIKTKDIESEITLTGNDEITELAHNIEKMRNSLIEKYADEKRAWEANNELIAAVSHDIRTPLTALIGYLDLLKEGSGISGEDNERYLENSYLKAMQLKDLTDRLFQYFLVYSGRIQIQNKEYDAVMLLDQIVGEHMAYLEGFGYRFELQEFERSGTISIDMAYLMRVFDNIFSNIEKYADRREPIFISREISDGTLIIGFRNKICRTKTGGESTKIGLRTCETIMKLLSGEFQYETDEERFTATVKLPIRTEE